MRTPVLCTIILLSLLYILGAKTVVVTFPYLSLLSKAFPEDEFTSLVPSDVDPHEYQLKYSDVLMLNKADVIVSTAHAPFELKIRQLVELGEVKAKLVELPLSDMVVYDYPGTNKSNLHAVVLDPRNFLALVYYLHEDLSMEVNETYVNEVEEMVRTHEMKYEGNVVVVHPAGQYAVSWLGFDVVMVLEREHGLPITPKDLERLEDMLSRGEVKAVFAIFPAGVDRRAIDMLRDIVGKYNVTLVVYDVSKAKDYLEYSKFIVKSSSAVSERVPTGGPKGGPSDLAYLVSVLALALVVYVVLKLRRSTS